MEELYKKVQAMFDEYHAPAHDFKHVARTSKLAKQIAQAEGYDVQEAEIAGLLHDIGRTVKNLQDTHAHAGAPIAHALLNKYTNLSEEAKERIVQSVYVHSDLHTDGKLNNIIQDADKLDGLGAIGISRAYNDSTLEQDYDPDNIIPPTGDYHNLKNSHDLITLELEWYRMLYTDEAKRIGKQRYEFTQRFLEEFKREVEESS